MSERRHQHPISVFFRFGALSGLGWLLDFATFIILVEMVAVQGFIANFLSSYVGVTFVFFTSLKFAFRHDGDGRNSFLIIYWGFQFLSIFLYSETLQMLADALIALPFHQLAAKIIITPFNLVTNFLFMKLLVSFMRVAARADG